MSREGFYGRRMVPEPLIKILQEMKEAGITKEDIQALAELTDSLENKQDKLTAGEGIEIDEDNVISATGGGGGVDPEDDNTFTGANTFEGETTFDDTVIINSTANIDEAEISTLYVNGDSFDDLIETHCHNIELTIDNCYVLFKLFSKKSTSYTLQDILTMFSNETIYGQHGEDDGGIASAYIKTSTSTVSARMIVFNNNAISTTRDSDIPFTSCSLSDTVLY